LARPARDCAIASDGRDPPSRYDRRKITSSSPATVLMITERNELPLAAGSVDPTTRDRP